MNEHVVEEQEIPTSFIDTTRSYSSFTAGKKRPKHTNTHLIQKVLSFTHKHTHTHSLFL